MLAGRYRVIEPIGRGGMGRIYRAHDTTLDQPVALKVLAPRLLRHPRARRRLLDEVRLARGVAHPNVCRVYDVREIDGLHFVAMELIDGEDLASLLRRVGRLPPERATEIGIEICAALAAIHERGILHRDLKPKNLMLDRRGRVRLLDFGLAITAENARGVDPRSGTPAYMAPEQIEGREVTARSDLYAAGLVLYGLYTGKWPFGPPEEAARRRRDDDPIPPRHWVGELDPAIERVILRALARDPRRRPASAEAIARVLRADAADLTGTLLRTVVAMVEDRVDRPDSERARALLEEHGDLRIAIASGVVQLFERPWEAVQFALAYRREVAPDARIGIHLGEISLRRRRAGEPGTGMVFADDSAAALARGLAVLARPGQTLLTAHVFDLARRGALHEPETGDLRWVAHGGYLFRGIDETVEVFEVGREGESPFLAPCGSEEMPSVLGGDVLPGWRPAPGLALPHRRHWRVERRLGGGGFGEVWLARHDKTGERRAYKFCFDASRLRGLRREITVFRLLKEELGDRPDIARLLDWNLDEAPYFVESEYTARGSLPEWAETQGGIAAVPLATRLEIVAQIADALAAAHSVGVLHKDVKPENVLITGENGEVRAQLADFGVGLVLDRERLDAAGITIVGLSEQTDLDTGARSSGTRLYMAPELLEGKPATVQADVFALGLVLYQMAIGDLTRALAPGWREELDDRLLADDIAAAVHGVPEHRLRDAAELASRLRRLEGRRAERRAQRRAVRDAHEQRRTLARAERRRRFYKAIAAMAIAALFVLALFAYWALAAHREAEQRRLQAALSADSVTAARREAEAYRQRAEDLVAFLLGELYGKLDGAGGSDVQQKIGAVAMRYFDSVPRDATAASERLASSEALLDAAKAHVKDGNPRAAMRAVYESLALARTLVEEDPDNRSYLKGLAARHAWLGRILRNEGRLAGAEEDFRTQLALIERLMAGDPGNHELRMALADARTDIGLIQKERGELEDALETFRSTLADVADVVERNPKLEWRLRLARTHNRIGEMLYRLGAHEEAIRHFRADQGISAALRARAADDADVLRRFAVSHLSLGDVLEARGERHEARRMLEAAIDAANRLAARDPTDTRSLHDLATAHRRLGRFYRREDLDVARWEVGRSLELLAYLHDKDPSHLPWRRDLAIARVDDGEILAAGGDFETARERASEAVALLELLTEDHAEDLASRYWLAEALVLRGRCEAHLGARENAVAAWQRAAEILEPRAHGSRDPRVLAPLAKAYLLLEESARAAPLQQRLREMGYHDLIAI